MIHTPRRRGRVPVVSRDLEPAPRRRPHPRMALSVAEVGVIIVFTLLILFAVAVPLRNYFQGRSEIAQVSQAIAAKQEQKAQLEGEISRYNSDAYVREQARRRLGVIDKGETAFRILDPAMDNAPNTGEQPTEDHAPTQWWQLLWDSVSTPPEPENKPAPIDMHLPLQAPAGQPTNAQ